MRLATSLASAVGEIQTVSGTAFPRAPFRSICLPFADVDTADRDVRRPAGIDRNGPPPRLRSIKHRELRPRAFNVRVKQKLS